MAMEEDLRECLRYAGRLSIACAGLMGRIQDIGGAVQDILLAKQEYDNAIFSLAVGKDVGPTPSDEKGSET